MGRTTPERASTKPMIIHIVRNMSLSEGGIPRFVRNLISFLDFYEYGVVCTSSQMSDSWDIKTNIRMVHICSPTVIEEISLPSYRLRKWVMSVLQITFPIRLSKLLKKMKANLVHCHYNRWIDLQAIAIIRKANLPMVWTIHVLPPDNEKELVRWRTAIDLIVHSGRGRIVAVSKAIVNRLAELGVCKAEDVTVIYNGVNLKQFFRNTHSKTGFLRLRFGLPQDAIVFGSVGFLRFEKGYDIFIKAAALLSQRVNNVFFAIAGSGSLAAELNSLIQQLGLKHRFRLVGFMDDVRPFLSALDVFVFPSRSEAHPLALIEALASGLPCIATSVGGIPEILGEGDGLLVPPESQEALAEAMYEMLSPERRQEYAARSQEIARRFSVDTFAEQYARIYEELISQKEGS